MRRPLSLLLLAGLVVAVPTAAPATADPAPHVEVWRGGLPTGYSISATPCTPQASPEPRYTYGQDLHPARGGGSLTVHNWNQVVRLSRSFDSLADLRSYAVSVTTWLEHPLGLEVAIPGAGLTATGQVPGALWNHWTRSDLVKEISLDWSDGFHGTVTAYAAGHPGTAALASSVALVTGCDSDAMLASSFAIDDIELGVGDTTTVLDLESSRYPILLGTDYRSLAYGRATTLRAQLREENGSVPGAPLQLWVRSAGSSATQLVTTTTTGADGSAEVTVKPERSSFYFWRYAAADDHPGTVSEGRVEVRVNAHISVRVRRQAVRPGDRVVAAVRVSEAMGQRVHLRSVGRRGHFLKALAAGTVGRDGVVLLRFRAPAHRPWRAVATVNSRDRLIGSHSRLVSLRVGGRTTG